MPGFLRDVKEEVQEDALARLQELVSDFEAVNKEIDELEATLKALTERKLKLGGTEIPQLLLQHGLSRIRLKDGREVTIKEGVSVSIPEDKRRTFFQFLTNRCEDDIVKLTVAFGRMANEEIAKLQEFLNDRAYDYNAEEKVHPQTLVKYFKGLLGLDVDEEERAEGVKDGRYLRVEDVSGFAKVFTYYSTKVK
jgi:hypothetical protein